MKKNKAQINKILLPLALAGVFMGGLTFASQALAQPSYGDVKTNMANDTPLPVINFEVIPSNFLYKGGEVSLTGTQEGYGGNNNDIAEIHYNWCVDSVPINGLVAGSNDTFDYSGGAAYLRNDYGRLEGGSGACVVEDFFPGIPPSSPEGIAGLENNSPGDTRITRTVDDEDDEDNDGMSDRWERDYFGRFAGQEIPNITFGGIVLTTTLPPDPNTLEFIQAIEPDQDFDSDGWQWNFIDNFYTFEAGLITLTASPPFQKPWQIGVPEVERSGGLGVDYQLYDGGNGEFTNYEEYVFGTNPIDPDTDADGIPDELDVCGREQANIPIIINKNYLEQYQINLHVFGVTQKYYVDPDSQARLKYIRTDLPAADGEVQVGAGMPLQLQMTYSPYPATTQNTAEDPVLVRSVSAMNETDSSHLFYRWILDGISQPTKDDISSQSGLAGIQSLIGQGDGEGDRNSFSGFGNTTFSFPISGDKNPCESHKVGLEVIEEDSGRSGFLEMEVPVAYEVNLSDGVLGNADENSPELPYFNSRYHQRIDYPQILLSANSSSYAQDILGPNTLPADPFVDSIDRQVGYRQNDLVFFDARLTGGSDQCIAETGNSELSWDEYQDQYLSYHWYVDGVEQQENSGVGPNFREFALALNNVAASDARDENDNSIIDVRFDILQKDTNDLLGSYTSQIRVVLPYIDLTDDGVTSSGDLEMVTDDPGNAIANQDDFYQVDSGATVTLNVEPKNFRPLYYFTDENDQDQYPMRVEWSRNNEIVAAQTVNNPSTLSYAFIAGETGQDIDDISVTISSTDSAGKEEYESATRTFTFTSSPTAGAALGGALIDLYPRDNPILILYAIGGAIFIGFVARRFQLGKINGR